MKKKQLVRQQFRDEVFSRDGHKCKKCGSSDGKLDAHHITDRTLMPAGGYVRQNGITLCEPCHELAEEFHRTGQDLKDYEDQEWQDGWHPVDLYELIDSSFHEAYFWSDMLKQGKYKPKDSG